MHTPGRSRANYDQATFSDLKAHFTRVVAARARQVDLAFDPGTGTCVGSYVADRNEGANSFCRRLGFHPNRTVLE